MVQNAYITSINSNTTLSMNNDTYIINISSDITITLPSITCDGIVFNLLRIDVTKSIVTINCSGGDLINGDATTTITYNGETIIRSLNGDWVTTDTIDAISPGGKYDFIFSSGGNPYITYATNAAGSPASICDFYYPGSSFGGGIPTIFAIIYSIPGTGVYRFDLLHLSGGTGVTLGSIIATITTTTTPTPPSILSTTTVTLANVSTTACIWEIRITRISGNQGTRVYNCFIGL